MAKGPGRLVLIVGASGVGKDTLIAYCRQRLGESDGVVFPRRAITRSSGDDAEEHEAISEGEFHRRKAAGDFAMAWYAHGLSYGLPATMDDAIAAGRTVVANVSRTVIDEARSKYANLRIVLVTAAPEIVAARLVARGRETGAALAQRIKRASPAELHGQDVVHLENSGPPGAAGDALCRLLRPSDETRHRTQ